MNVLIVCQDDWANVGYGFEMSLREAGVNAMSLKYNRHSFGYPEQSRLFNDVPIDELFRLSMLADFVVFMHSQAVDLPVGFFSKHKRKYFVFHGGTAYRENSKAVRDFFYGHGIKHYLIQNVDLLSESLGLDLTEEEKEFLVLPAIDTLRLKPQYDDDSKKIIIAHYPRGKKGTKEINSVMSEFDGYIIYKRSLPEAPVPWLNNVQRIQECDIYISALSQGGVDGIGVTALEAAAMGKIVLAPMKEAEVYSRSGYGDIPFLNAKDEHELMDIIENLIKMDRLELRHWQEKTREWAEEYVSYRATGEKLRGIFEGI